ncbi:hypothetical protein HPB51_004421 [Rhipicephalus microplus]|uniref:Uncharacterized protein n=1 Tax=Rhipicephalus microplus TaxID=6941 RepID=A0A9J6EM17_RHIMP|nr:hypothetical protein HPB51_004421 [Rhipicephalus microplus]
MQPRATRFKIKEGEMTLRWKSDTWSTRFIPNSDQIGNNKINRGENIPSLKPVAWSRARGIRRGLSEATAKRTNPNTPASSAALAAFQQAAVATGANHELWQFTFKVVKRKSRSGMLATSCARGPRAQEEESPCGRDARGHDRRKAPGEDSTLTESIGQAAGSSKTTTSPGP